MTNKINDAFDNIKAEEKLKQSTLLFLEKRMRKRNHFPMRDLVIVLASLLLVLFTGFSSYKLYFTTKAVLDIDVNPSIELTLNCFDRVIAADAYNTDGKELLTDVNIMNKSYKDALDILIAKMEEQGYLKDFGLFSATLQANRDKEESRLLSELETYVDTILKGYNKDVQQNIFKVDHITKVKSHDAHVSPAKYLAIKELQSFDSTVTIDSCQNHSIGEINRQIESCKNGQGSESHKSGAHHRHKKR